MPLFVQAYPFFPLGICFLFVSSIAFNVYFKAMNEASPSNLLLTLCPLAEAVDHHFLGNHLQD
jgi:hypothetical protein